jgi:hypothetical protein
MTKSNKMITETRIHEKEKTEKETKTYLEKSLSN